MRPPTSLERLYIDFDSFFASAEQQLQPHLRGRPIGVVPLPSEATCVIAASREAKRAGVRTGTPVREARLLCPDIVMLPARHDEYVRLHKRIVAEVDRHAPVIAARSIDEMVTHLPAGQAGAPEHLARRIKAGLAEAVGPFLTCSIGVSSNELLAKIAAEMEKPDGFVILHPKDLPGRLFDLALTDLPGVATNMARRLAAAGVTDVAGLWNLAPKQARALWGGVGGERFWMALHGYAIEAAPTQRGMFGHSRVLAWDWRPEAKARACARLLLTKAARRLRREGFLASVVAVSLRGEDGVDYSAQESLQPARDDHAFLAAFDRLWTQAARVSRYRQVMVSLHGLKRAHETSGDLFAPADDRRARRERLSDVVDAIAAAYGGDTISIGAPVRLPGGYAGGKIAFGRVPSLADF